MCLLSASFAQIFVGVKGFFPLDETSCPFPWEIVAAASPCGSQTGPFTGIPGRLPEMQVAGPQPVSDPADLGCH